VGGQTAFDLGEAALAASEFAADFLEALVEEAHGPTGCLGARAWPSAARLAMAARRPAHSFCNSRRRVEARGVTLLQDVFGEPAVYLGLPDLVDHEVLAGAGRERANEAVVARDFLPQNPAVVRLAAAWCTALDNIDLGILLLTQPWIAGEGLRRSDLERQLSEIGCEMPVGTVYFQRISRARTTQCAARYGLGQKPSLHPRPCRLCGARPQPPCPGSRPHTRWKRA